MRKKVIAIILILFVITSFAMGMISCKDNNGDNSQNNSTPVDSFYTKGYVKAGVPSLEFVHKDFILSITNMFKKAENTTINANNPYCNVKLDADVSLNGEKYSVVFNLSYNLNDDKTLIWDVTLTNSQNKDLLSFAFISYASNQFSNLYVKLADTKIKIPISKEIIESSFPLVVDKTISSGFETFFVNIVRVKEGSIKYEYASATGGITRHYYYEVDILETLKQLYDLTSLFGIDKQNIDYLISNLLGVNESALDSGKVPDSVLSLEYYTVDGYQNTPGRGTISKVKAIADIEESQYKETIFEGKGYHIEAYMDSILVNNTKNESIRTENYYSDYPDYDDNLFRLSLNSTIDGDANKYNLITDFIYDSDQKENVYLNVNMTSTIGAVQKFSLQYQDGTLTSFLCGKDLSVDFDMGGLIDGVIDYFKQRKIDGKTASTLKIVSYFLGAIRVDGNTVSFKLDHDSFKEISGLDAETLLNLIDDNSSIDIADYLSTNQIDFAKLVSTTIKLTVDLDKEFLVKQA